MENKKENSGLSEREIAIAFMLRKDKPGIAKRKPVPEPTSAMTESGDRPHSFSSSKMISVG